MRRRRLLLVTPDYPPAVGGIQLLLHRLATHLERWDTEVVTLAPPRHDGSHDAVPHPGAPGPRIRRVGRPGAGGQRAAVARLNAAALRRGLAWRPDIVLNGHIATAPAALALRRVLGTPYVQYVYADELPHRPALSRRAMAGAATVLAVSGPTGELAVAHGAAPERLEVVHPGVDTPAPRQVSRAAEPLVVTVSRLRDLYKGHDVLLRAAPLVAARVPGARWVLVGDGPLRPHYEASARAAGLDGRVLFTGAVSTEEREAWLDRAHVFAMPSRRSGHGGGEGFGIVYLEASAHGVPVVAGDDGGARDAVEDGATGLLVDATDPVAVAEAVASLLLDPARAEAMGRRGAERAAALSWPVMAARVGELLDRVASTSAAPERAAR